MLQTSGLTRRLTSKEFFALFPDEDGVRRELIDGEIVVTPSPLIRHQILAQRIGLSLFQHVETHPSQGSVFFVPVDVVLSEHDVVVPDVHVVLGDQLSILTNRNVQGAPAIVAEILSASTRKRDLTLKFQLYERQGVREYWVIDPAKNTVTTHSLAGRRFSAGVTHHQSEVLETPLLPGWSLDLSQFFR